MTHDWHATLSDWLQSKALPLWSGAGVDVQTGTVWEALDHQGQPLPDLERRLRVQQRQAYCFAQTGYLDLARQLYRFALQSGFDPHTGHLAAWLNPDLTIKTAPHDLYDLAFGLLASAALLGAGAQVEGDLAKLELAVAQLKADRGWHENAARGLPRRQNPHMHLFEAFTALFEATSEPRFRDHAEECLGLFRDVFLRADGRVLEFFEADWTPLEGTAQAIEPGHMAEWIYLLDRYETVTGRKSGVDLSRLYAAVLDERDGAGLLPNASFPPPLDGKRRLWPQTELLKAALVMGKRGLTPETAPDPDEVLATMWTEYFDTDVPGGWYDERSADGQLLSNTMPASTFYHILVAFRMYLDTARPA